MAKDSAEAGKKFQLTQIADRAVFHDPVQSRQTRRDLRRVTWENLNFHLVVDEQPSSDDVRGRKIAALARFELERRMRVAANWRAVWASVGAVLAGAIATLSGVAIEKHFSARPATTVPAVERSN